MGAFDRGSDADNEAAAQKLHSDGTLWLLYSGKVRFKARATVSLPELPAAARRRAPHPFEAARIAEATAPLAE